MAGIQRRAGDLYGYRAEAVGNQRFYIWMNTSIAGTSYRLEEKDAAAGAAASQQIGFLCRSAEGRHILAECRPSGFCCSALRCGAVL